MLCGKNIVLAVTGSIAAYKIAGLASMLKKLDANITVLMTKNATNFINPITFETLTGNKCLVDTFDRNFQYNVEHVALAKQADVVMIAPASANVIGKIANGIADDMLTTTVMACGCKKIIAPAMNTQMYRNPIVQDNLELKESIVDKLFKIAAVDGFPCQEALDILKKTAQLIKLPDGNFAVIAAVYMPKKETSTMQDYYSVLGVACNAGDKEIKKRWKSLIVQYHPDRLQAQGASQEEIEAATAKMAEINNAYQMIMKAKKI